VKQAEDPEVDAAGTSGSRALVVIDYRCSIVGRIRRTGSRKVELLADLEM
jgi:hypothetical protein